MLLLVALVSAQQMADTVLLSEVISIATLHESIPSPLLDIKYQSTKRLSDVLQAVSSVYIKSYGVGQLASIAIEGTSASQTEVQWNGIKLNSPSLGQCDLSLFILGMQDGFELVNTGSKGVIGGTLQLENKMRTDSGIGVIVALRAGSFGMFEGNGKLKYAKNRFSGATSFSYIRAKNNFKYRNIFEVENPYRTQQNGAVEQISFLQQFGAKIGRHNQLNFYLWLTETDRQISPIMSKPNTTETQSDYSVRALVKWKADFELLNLGFTSAYLQDQIRYKNPEIYLNERSATQAIRNVFSAAYKFKFNLHISTDINYDHERANIVSYAVLRTRNTLGIKWYADYFLKNDLKFHVGFRQDLIDTKLSAFAPEFSLGYFWKSKDWKLKHKVRIEILGSRNFRFPTLNDMYWMPGGNPNLKQEKAWNGGLYFEYKYQEIFNLQARNFYIYVDDWIQWIPQGTIWMPVNFKRVFSRGVAVDLHISNASNKNSKKFLVFGTISYTFTKTTNLSSSSAFDQSKGKQLIYVPLHRVVASMQLEYKKFYIRTVNNYQSKVYTATDNSQSLKGYFTSNLEIGKTFLMKQNEFGVSFAVLNISNTNYQSVAQRPLPGRSFEATLRYSLK